jgi:alpha-tubulin suppressor-like RCC1 family protein
LSSDNKAYCWGNNSNGQLGNGSNTNTSAPTTVILPAGVNFSQLVAGGLHTCALGSDGKVYCWGYNFFGQVGNGSDTNSSTPTAVILPSGVSISQVAAGENHTCGLSSDSKVFCWGNNEYGQLGNGTDTNSPTPIAVILPSGVSISQVVARGDHTCGMGSDSKVYCWGVNYDGQLGNGTDKNSSTPSVVLLPSGMGFSQIVAGGNHTCALGSNSKVYCWGLNDSGQLGNNSDTSSTTPVEVSQP